MAIRAGILFILLTLAFGAAMATPTALNLIPTADVLEAGELTLQVETDGYTDPFASDADLYFMTQFGLGEGLELGLDAYQFNHQGRWVGNAKFQVLSETEHRPAVAVGMFSRGIIGPSASWYLAATRDIEPLNVRVTSGAIFDDGWRWMVGFENYFTDRCGVLVDWTSGPNAWATLGLSYEASPGLWITPYYGWNNTTSDDNFLGLNFYWQGECE